MRLTDVRAAIVHWAADGVSGADVTTLARDLDVAARLSRVVLVEGVSDCVAIEALAVRLGRALEAEGVCVIPMGGATSIGRFLELLGPSGLGVELAGLCDHAEERYFQRALERCGLGSEGFFVCVEDLEDELIRAHGIDSAERVIESQGDLRALRTFQRQPAQRSRAPERQLRRFFGTMSGRKAGYARALVDGLDLANTPAPLAQLLDYI